MIDLSTEGGRILLVDDDSTYQALMQRKLERAGHTLRTAPDIETALRVADRDPPDLVLLDYRLPGTTGLEVCERLRADERFRFTPMILLSNHTTIELIDEAVRVGVNDFIEKDEPVPLLLLRIRAGLRSKRLADLAEQRYQEVLFLSSVGTRLNRTLRLKEVLDEAVRAALRFRPGRLFVLMVDDEHAPALRVYGGQRPGLESAVVGEVIERARAAMSVNIESAELDLSHHPQDWPETGGGPLIGHAPTSATSARAFVALEPAEPLDESAEALFVALVDRLAPPLLNARLYKSKHEANERLSAAFKALAQEQAERVAAERLSSIGQLAAGVAHEINNPLAFVISNLNVLKDYVDDLGGLLELFLSGRGDEARALSTQTEPHFLLEDLEPLINETRQGAERVHHIVRKLRGFTQIQGGDATVNVDLESVIDNVLHMLHGQLVERGLEIERSGGGVPRVLGDSGKLSQVFLNLLNHATERALQAESPRISVHTGPSAGEATVVFTDNGPVIGPEELGHLFEPFADPSTVTLGSFDLAISEEIVRRHGGRIVVKSEEGTTRFAVRIPARSTVPLPTVVAEPGPNETPRGHALFIDDERFLLNAYKRAFSASVEVHVAHGGEEGIKLLQQLPQIDVVLCDLVMPRVNGVAVYDWVKEHRPDLLERFLIVTGGQHGDRNRAFLDRTGLPVIHKPFRVKEVQKLLRRYLGVVERADASSG